MSRTHRALLAATAAAIVTAAAPARAQMAHIPQNDWRQPDRHDVVQAKAGKARFAFELRFGPYLPNIDGEFNGKTPFTDVFGIDCDATSANTPLRSVRLRSTPHGRVWTATFMSLSLS